MFSFSDQVWKEMQMGEVVTLLTYASGQIIRGNPQDMPMPV
jgi:hypothetical protein